MALLACGVLPVLSPAEARQAPAPPRVAVGFGVDTASSPNRDILALYRAYLAHRLDSVRPSPYWSREEQSRWPAFDLLGGMVYQGFPSFTVVHLAPAAGLDSAYLIRTLISSVDDSAREVRPLALYRVYATREDGRWVLANALPRLTRSWQRDKIGRVTFVRPPSRPFDRARAGGAAAFVDSLARAFEVPAPAGIDYYFTDDLLDTFAAMGLDYFPIGSDTVGGRAFDADGLVFIGSSRNGESYRHELAHVVLAPLFVAARPPGLLVEGLMTWTGGSAGLGFRELLPDLAQYVRTHPDLTLATLMADPPRRQGTLDVGYDGLAALCDMVFQKGGVTAIRSLLAAGASPEATLSAAAGILEIRQSELDAAWRRRILAAR